MSVIVKKLKGGGYFAKKALEPEPVPTEPKNSTFTSIDGTTLEISIDGAMNRDSLPFDRKEIVSMTIGTDVTAIETRTFVSCTALTSVTLTSTITKVDNEVFRDCTNLTSVILPSNLTSFGEQAFAGCSKLTEITIPQSVTSIGSMAFFSCDKLSTVTYEGTIAQWNTISKGSSWANFSPISVVHCSDGDVSI